MKKYLFISLIILSGCSQNIANFTLVSTESTNLDKEYESIDNYATYEDFVKSQILKQYINFATLWNI